jgi:hypothetical protein
MDISLILSKNYNGSIWTLNGDDYSGLTWLSETPKPTEKELQAQWADVEYQAAYDAVTVARQAGYQSTSDPIFMQYQRGEATEQEWLDAVQAVKDANPYPVKEGK